MDRHRAQRLLLLVTKALTGIPVGEMMREGWKFSLMRLPLLGMNFLPQIVLRPQTMDSGGS
jgi:hypothetical protein